MSVPLKIELISATLIAHHPQAMTRRIWELSKPGSDCLSTGHTARRSSGGMPTATTTSRSSSRGPRHASPRSGITQCGLFEHMGFKRTNTGMALTARSLNSPDAEARTFSVAASRSADSCSGTGPLCEEGSQPPGINDRLVVERVPEQDAIDSVPH